jgi:hypothetical protein
MTGEIYGLLVRKPRFLMAVHRAGAGRAFPGLVTWRQQHHTSVGVSVFLDLFDALAREADPFPRAYPTRYLTP